MAETRVIRVRESILEENRVNADALRARLTAAGVSMVNVMSSPGSGKTSLILKTIATLGSEYRIAVIEADLDSTVDADKVAAVGIPVVQIETGGFCHLDAVMVQAAVADLSRAGADVHALDILFLENVGNLICTAQHDTGAHANVAILSVPEGDDKPLKYPLMFRTADVVVVNKTDYLEIAEFAMDAVRERVRVLNPSAPLIPVSCRTGNGMAAWVDWLRRRVDERPRA